MCAILASASLRRFSRRRRSSDLAFSLAARAFSRSARLRSQFLRSVSSLRWAACCAARNVTSAFLSPLSPLNSLSSSGSSKLGAGPSSSSSLSDADSLPPALSFSASAPPAAPPDFFLFGAGPPLALPLPASSPPAFSCSASVVEGPSPLWAPSSPAGCADPSLWSPFLAAAGLPSFLLPLFLGGPPSLPSLLASASLAAAAAAAFSCAAALFFSLSLRASSRSSFSTSRSLARSSASSPRRRCMVSADESARCCKASRTKSVSSISSTRNRSRAATLEGPRCDSSVPARAWTAWTTSASKGLCSRLPSPAAVAREMAALRSTSGQHPEPALSRAPIQRASTLPAAPDSSTSSSQMLSSLVHRLDKLEAEWLASCPEAPPAAWATQPASSAAPSALTPTCLAHNVLTTSATSSMLLTEDQPARDGSTAPSPAAASCAAAGEASTGPAAAEGAAGGGSVTSAAGAGRPSALAFVRSSSSNSMSSMGYRFMASAAAFFASLSLSFSSFSRACFSLRSSSAASRTSFILARCFSPSSLLVASTTLLCAAAKRLRASSRAAVAPFTVVASCAFSRSLAASRFCLRASASRLLRSSASAFSASPRFCFQSISTFRSSAFSGGCCRYGGSSASSCWLGVPVAAGDCRGAAVVAGGDWGGSVLEGGGG
mmetsp:Transcript_7854/g.20942  ORF Transcript_7854/g.20942 Transcript_7854/m.20942 type:complete len:661 (+) Transcript_7854:1882-3864(+)